MSAGDRAHAEAAAEWVVRLSSEEAGPDAWAAFQAWLDDETGAREDYDQALDAWLLAQVGDRRRKRAPMRELVRGGGRGWAAIAAALVLVLLGGAGGWLAWRSSPSTVLQTAADERRSFHLADGSTVALGGDSRVVVEMGPRRRTAVMKRGDAVFQVASLGLRPFEVVAGDDALRVVGTEFGVHRRDGRLRVVVRHGLVAIGPAQGDDGPRVRLPAGSELNHVEGTKTFQVSEAVPSSDFDWRGSTNVKP